MTTNDSTALKNPLRQLALFGAAMGGVAVIAYAIGYVEVLTTLFSIDATWLIHEYPASVFWQRSVIFFIAVILFGSFAIIRIDLLYLKKGREAVSNYGMTVVFFSICTSIVVLIYVGLFALGSLFTDLKNLAATILPYTAPIFLAGFFVSIVFGVAVCWKLGYFKDWVAVWLAIFISSVFFVCFLPFSTAKLQARYLLNDASSSLPIIRLSEEGKVEYFRDGERIRLLLNKGDRFYALRFPKGQRCREGVLVLDSAAVAMILPADHSE